MQRSCMATTRGWLSTRCFGTHRRRLIAAPSHFVGSVALCRVDGQDIGEWLAHEGWALDYRQFSKGAYAAAEAEARQAGKGVWSGRFILPWEWRRKRR